MAGPYDCPECGRGFSSLTELTRHTETEHTHDVEPAAQADAQSAGALSEAADPDAVSSGGSQLVLALLLVAVVIAAIVFLVV